MARKRMFSLDVVDTDTFLEMPHSVQNLYFHFGMRADDDGFVSSPKKIMKMIGANEEDLKSLISKNYIIPFESGVILIKHWNVNNYLRKDRYLETIYKDEKRKISKDENGIYFLVYQMTTNGLPSIDKSSIEKNSVVAEEVKKDEINSNDKSSESINFYKNNINYSISEYEQQVVKQFVNNYGDDLVKRAMQISIERNNKNLSYVTGILNDWNRKGIKTIEQTFNEKKDSVIEQEKSELEKEKRKKENEILMSNLVENLKEEKKKNVDLHKINMNSPIFSCLPNQIKEKIKKEIDEEIEI